MFPIGYVASSNRHFTDPFGSCTVPRPFSASIDATVYEYRLDPIRYAWEHCNLGVSFPSLLARSTGPSRKPSGQSAADRAPVLVEVDPEASGVRAARHSLIVGPRPHRNAKP